MSVVSWVFRFLFLFFFFSLSANLFICQLKEDRGIRMSAPFYKLLEDIVLVEGNDEKMASLRHRVQKGTTQTACRVPRS